MRRLSARLNRYDRLAACTALFSKVLQVAKAASRLTTAILLESGLDSRIVKEGTGIVFVSSSECGRSSDGLDLVP